MAVIVVDVDEAAVREMFASWDGPVGSAVQAAVDEIEAIAVGLAPVSPVGSKFSPPGNLKTSTHQSAEHHYDESTHEVLGLVGAPRYPFNFIANPTSHKGYTTNPRSAKRPGRVTRRRADDDYLSRAIDLAPDIVIGHPD